MPSIHARSEILLGSSALTFLNQQHILVAGLGGVGGYVAENLARAGIGKLSLLDFDSVTESNRNRQLLALASTVGQKKTAVMAARIHDINPAIKLHLYDTFMHAADAPELLSTIKPDFIADCIDSVASKAALIQAAQQQQIPIISALGAGNRLDVRHVKISELAAVTHCGLGKALRKRLREMHASLKHPVIYSDEVSKAPKRPPLAADKQYREKAINGTISYMPALFGVLLSGEIIRQLLEKHRHLPTP